MAKGKRAAFDWRKFLEVYSGELLAEPEIQEQVPRKVIKSGRMGFEGASEEAIATLERRLGTQLPHSYREFLKVSNGWHHPGEFVYRLWGTTKVAWFRKRHKHDWIDPWIEGEAEGERQAAEQGRISKPISDAKYLVYGEEQDCCNMRSEYLETALEISDVGDAAIYLLNPKIVRPDGEWEAWVFASWHPGAQRFRSFQELMEAERLSALALRKPKP